MYMDLLSSHSLMGGNLLIILFLLFSTVVEVPLVLDCAVTVLFRACTQVYNIVTVVSL